MTAVQTSRVTSYDAPRTTQVLFLSVQWLRFLAPVIFLVLVFTLPLLVLLIEGSGVASHSRETLDGLLGWVFPLVGLVAVLATGLSRLSYRLNQKQAHKRRTRHALSIVEALERGERPPFCLYLRPFLSSDGLYVPNSLYRRRFLPSMDRFFGRRIDLETVFAMALEHRAHPLIAIGDTGFELGAAKIVTSDQDWRAVFARLAHNASAILMVPLPRPSTVWELDYILGQPDLLAKTLFVMPMRLRAGVQERLEPFWRDMRSSMRLKGVDFPELSPRGGFFCLRDAGATLHLIDSGGFDVDYVDQVLTGLINRSRVEELYQQVSPEARRAMPAFLEGFLYFAASGRLHTRPLPRHLLPSSGVEAEIFDCLSVQGFLMVHRSQEGSNAWWETHLHPALIDWPRLVAWAQDRDESLRQRGVVVEGSRQAVHHWHEVLSSHHRATLAVQAAGYSQFSPPAAKINGRPVGSAPLGLLRPEERSLLGELGRPSADAPT